MDILFLVYNLLKKIEILCYLQELQELAKIKKKFYNFLNKKKKQNYYYFII